MRVNGQHVARNWTQFESNLPNGRIEPAVVKVEQNDNKVEGYPVFEKLVELSWIGITPDEAISVLWLEKMTNQDGEVKFWNEASCQLLDRFGLCYKFLHTNYHRRRAYVKVGNREIYWQVSVSERRFHMRTSEGILTMPAVSIADQITGETQVVFFPMSALLREEEQALFELYKNATQVDETATLERDIMRLLEKLAITSKKNQSIVETNSQLAEIEEMCKSCWTIKRLYLEDWKLVLDFDWRLVKDSDWERKKMVLPPVKILIDLRNYTVRGNYCYHPHVMTDNTLCMGWTLTNLAEQCINNRDLKTLVGGMIDFGNSWTSSDAGESDRHPANCIIRYHQNVSTVDWNNLPVTKEEIRDTLYDRGYELSDLWTDFSNLFNE